MRSFGSSNQTVGVVNPLANDLNICDAASTPACGLKISGIASSTGGAGGYSYTTRSFTTPQFFDDASKILGNHSVKFGIAVERQEFNLNQIPPAGSWAFGSLVNFLTNVPTSYQPPTIVAVTHEWGMRDTVLGGYVQDDWRLHPNLTLNIGLRYEMLTNPTEVHGNFASLTSVTGDASAVRRGNPLYPNNSTLHDVSPRVGFAYDPFGDGKTSIRAGYGVFDVLPMIYQWAHEIIGVYPFEYAALDSKPAAGSFYNGITPSQLSTSSYTVMYIQPNMKRSYVQQWNLTMQREVAPNLTATVSYVGSVGTHLSYRTVDSNGIDPTLTSAGYLYPHPILSTNPIINPNFGEIQGTYYIGNSSYNALQVMVNKRMSHGFQIQGSYTWGRSIDDTSSQVAQFDSQTALETPLNPAFIPPSRYRGPSDFNTDQTFVANGIWQVPEARLRSRFAGRIVNGWQLGGIYKAAGGEPFTPTFGNGGNVTGANSLANTDPGFPDRLSGPGCGSATHPQKANNYINLNCFSLPTAPNMAYWTANCDHTSKIYGSTKTTEPYPICFNLMGNAARNSINGPGLSELDFSAFKNNKIGERYNLQFRAEIFNILNRVNFADPPNTTDTDLYTSNGVASGSAGVLTTTATSSRQIQFALKLTW